MVNLVDLHLSCELETFCDHKERFGQFFTPEPVARFMVEWVLDCAPDEIDEIYDPAFGLGAFYFATRAVNKLVKFAGSEIDPIILHSFRGGVFDPRLSLSCEDYLRQWGKKRTAIVCNPPYMRFHKFLNRNVVFEEFQDHLGLKLSGYTNIASAFLVKSISELVPGGRLAYIMPLEFLNTKYGNVVKEYLLSNGRIHALIRLNCEREIFPDVTTTVGIILFEKASSPGVTNFYVVHKLEELQRLASTGPVNGIVQLELQPHDSWLKYFEPQMPQIVNDKYLVPLAYYGTFSRGIATGANEFFILRPSQVASLDLPTSEVVECITKSPQIRKPVFTEEDYKSLLSRDAPVLLFTANQKPSNQATAYIERGERRGFHKRYLTRVRNPWYRIELQQPAPLWIGVFSRDGYKVVRNYSRALTLTCFHSFQPNLFGIQWVNHLFLYLMSTAGRKILMLNIRKYGNALDKFEPNDLNYALVPSIEWFSRITEQAAAEETETVRVRGMLSAKMEQMFDTLKVLSEPLRADRFV